MKSPVQLYIRVRLDDGSYPYLKAVMLPNGHVRPVYAINAGRAVKVTSGTYQLRYQRDGKRIWEPVGSEPDVALIALRRKIREIEDAELGITSVLAQQASASVHAPGEQQQRVTTPGKSNRSLLACVAEYLTETNSHKEPKTFAAYNKALLSFAAYKLGMREAELKKMNLEQLGDTPCSVTIESLTREDALAWIAALRDKKNQPRTLRNRATQLNSFVRHFKLPSLLTGKDKPSFTKKKVLAYNEDVLTKMLEYATEDEADLLYFFLCTGGREGDVSAACWSDVEMTQKLYKVTEHLDLGYRPKDKEEEPVPIPDLLVERLRERRKRYPRTRLIFGTAKGKRDGHMLRTIKELALRAGANCCECINKQGQSCIEHPVCSHIKLHRLRKTFATTLHHNGLPAQTIQRYLRHSDLATTLAYLADQPDDHVRETINATFAVGGFRRIPRKAA
jgi:integrase